MAHQHHDNAICDRAQNIYVDEPEVMEIEVKEALKHIYLIENQQDVMGYP